MRDIPYLGNTLRYLVLCSTYRIHTVYIGEYPYNEDILPALPAAFSYRSDASMPSTISEMLRYFPDDDGMKAKVARMFRDSWSMLPMGVAMINIDYMSGGRLLNEEVRGVQYMGRVDQMSYFISGVAFGSNPSEEQLHIVGIGRAACCIAKEVRDRLGRTGRSAVVHEMKQPVSGSRRGVTEEEVESGSFSIFDSTTTKGKLMHDAMMMDLLSKGGYTKRALESYSRILSRSETMASSNSMMINGIQETCRLVGTAAVALRSEEGVSNDDAKNRLCGMVSDMAKCVGAVARMKMDDIVVGAGQTAELSMSARNYSTSVTSTTQRPDMKVSNNGIGAHVGQVYSFL